MNATELDKRTLMIQVTVNGREKQPYPASDMIKFPIEVAHQIIARYEPDT